MNMRDAQQMMKNNYGKQGPENMDTKGGMAKENKMGFRAFTPAADKKKKKYPWAGKKKAKAAAKPVGNWTGGQMTDSQAPTPAPGGQWKYNTMIK